MVNELLQKFRSPGAEFRGAPFWAWNGKLTEEELLRQIGIFKEMGLGGFFIHSRVGLETPYLSEEWFDKVACCIAAAEKAGLLVYLYDEDRWPSGSAGGMVTADKSMRIRAISFSSEPVAADEDTELFGAFAIENREGEPAAWHRLAPGEKAERPLYFYVRLSAPDPWFNGNTYPDTLNPETIRRFIRLTHEQYAARFGDKFGSTIRAIFTDEPNFRSAHFSENVKLGTYEKPLPWTPALPERFKEKYGYDLLDHLPELFFDRDGGEFSKVRLDYFNLITELFVNAYFHQLGAWSEAHHLPLTGHVHWEDSLLLQRHQVGSAMRSYEFMQMPGVDLLSEHFAVIDTIKQCVSVASQLGKSTRLSELYGCTGWDFPFAGHKALGEWQYALGINFRCLHLSWFTMAGEAKRDYPASISFQSPWHRQYPVVEDHFARLGAALSEGKEVREILVIHPIESTLGWKDDARISREESDAEDRKIIDLRNVLLAQNLDFDYGDEELLSRYGKIAGKRFVAGEMDYGAVVIPQLRTIRRTTLELLTGFQAAGGTVLFLGTPPEYVDGVASAEGRGAFAKFQNVTLANVAAALSPRHRKVSILADGREIDPALSLMKRGKDFQTLFVCNVGHNQNIRTLANRMTGEKADGIEGDQKIEPGVLARLEEFPDVEIAWESLGGGRIVELDLDNGKIYPVESCLNEGKMVFHTSLPRLGSRLFLETTQLLETVPRPAEPQGRIVSALPADQWAFELDEPNVLVLDQAYCNGAEKRDFILNIDAALRDKLGSPRRGGAMQQPYSITDRTRGKTIPVTLEYRFNVKTLPAEDLELVLEHPELYTITVNGKALAWSGKMWWVDPALRRTKVSAGWLKTGENRIVLATEFHRFHPGFEAIFLLGNFGVSGDEIVPMPQTLAFGDWTEQGLPYYAGNLTYRGRFTAAGAPQWLRFGAWRGCALGVSVNGIPVKLLPWPPYQLELTPYLRDGENEIAITVFGHRRNAFGPFYCEDVSPSWAGPAQFKTFVQSERHLVPCGVLDAPVLIQQAITSMAKMLEKT